MAIRAAQFVGDSSPRAALLARCRGYVTVASEALAPRRAVLVLVGGVSGSGKSWLAARLAAGLDGLHLRSDLERKRLAGLATTAGSGSPLGGGLYSAEWNARTYDRLLRAAGNVLASGRIAIVDATFLEASQRDPFRALAAERGVACHHIECTAPEAVLRERILRRRAEGGDPSEADLAVLERQLARQDMPGQGADAPLVVIDTAAADTVQRALAALLSRNGRG
jgi:predicted kinase